MICKCKLVQQKMLGQYVNGLCSKGRMEEAIKLVEELLERKGKYEVKVKYLP